LLHKLNPQQYQLVKPLFQHLSHHLALQAIIDGNLPDTAIYVDNVDNPQTALTWAVRRVYLAGDAQNLAVHTAIRELLGSVYYQQAKTAGWEVYILFYDENWHAMIDSLFADKRLYALEQLSFTHQALPSDLDLTLPDEIRLQVIDRDFLQQTHLQNLDAVREEMTSERNSIEDFLAHSFGVCLVKGDEIIGWCMSEYNHDGKCEVGIEVVEVYQRQGLGKKLAANFIRYAASQHIKRIGWHCRANNPASIALAQALGFVQIARHPSRVAYHDEPEES
jgi:RimJ/RimL family protein N-acetyltransferase